MPRNYVPVWIRAANATREMRLRLRQLVDGAPWMRPEERKVAIEFLRDTLKHYKKSGVEITPVLSYHLETAMTYIALLHRLEHENVPRNYPSTTPDSPRNHPPMTPESHPDHPLIPPAQVPLAHIRALRAQLRITLQHLDHPAHNPGPTRAATAAEKLIVEAARVTAAEAARQERQRIEHEYRNWPPSHLPPEEQDLLRGEAPGTTVAQVRQRERDTYIAWRKGPAGHAHPLWLPVPKEMTPTELDDLDRLYGTAAERRAAQLDYYQNPTGAPTAPILEEDPPPGSAPDYTIEVPP